MSQGGPTALAVELRLAIHELSERGLNQSVKWAAEQLCGLPQDAIDQDQLAQASKEIHAEGHCKYLLAKSLFDGKVTMGISGIEGHARVWGTASCYMLRSIAANRAVFNLFILRARSSTVIGAFICWAPICCLHAGIPPGGVCAHRRARGQSCISALLQPLPCGRAGARVRGFSIQAHTSTSVEDHHAQQDWMTTLP